MKNSSLLFRVGTRSSKLAKLQTTDALQCFSRLLPDLDFEVVPFASPGDRDQNTDLRESPPDFFTRDLDDALRNHTIDLAIHSAKDLPDPLPEDLEAFHIPCREDARDALVLPAGQHDLSSLPASPRIGVSSERREDWCLKRFPDAIRLPIRGTIERRLKQLDNGDYDAVIIAAAALIRLSLEDRISEWIPLEALPSPEGQGILAATFRAGDPRVRALRDLFVKTVVFAGAGAGRAGTCTMETVQALQRAEVCMHDSLLDPGLLKHLPENCRILDVGKRCGERGVGQSHINRLLIRFACQGERVVRLKGGDPGIFGRLTEELEALEALGLPCRILPGISSLQMATTGTGLLLTQRGVNRGFCVVTPRSDGGRICSVGRDVLAALPQVVFMGTTAAGEIFSERLREGADPDTPVAIVYEAGSPYECIWQSTLQEAAANPPKVESPPLPGLILIGIGANGGRAPSGALGGRRILLTCSEALIQEASDRVRDAGGIPLPFPSIRLVPDPDGIAPLLTDPPFDWLVLTSPSAVHAALAMVKAAAWDLRRMPSIMVCGKGTAQTLCSYGLQPDAVPTCDFGSGGLIETAASRIHPGARVLRLRSDAAGPGLAEALGKQGAIVTDRIILHNRPVEHPGIPPFDDILFASRSAVIAFLDRPDAPDLNGRLIAAIGKPTAAELTQRGISSCITGHEATIASAVSSMAAYCVNQAIGQAYAGVKEPPPTEGSAAKGSPRERTFNP